MKIEKDLKEVKRYKMSINVIIFEMKNNFKEVIKENKKFQKIHER